MPQSSFSPVASAFTYLSITMPTLAVPDVVIAANIFALPHSWVEINRTNPDEQYLVNFEKAVSA